MADACLWSRMLGGFESSPDQAGRLSSGRRELNGSDAKLADQPQTPPKPSGTVCRRKSRVDESGPRRMWEGDVSAIALMVGDGAELGQLVRTNLTSEGLEARGGS
jgi:hypothetical protein